MTAPRTDPQSTVPVEPLSPKEYRADLDEIEVGDLSDYQRGYIDGFDAPVNLAARASQPITAPALAEAILVAAKEDGRRPTSDGFEWYGSADEMAAGILAALPVREDEPTGIDVDRLLTAFWNVATGRPDADEADIAGPRLVVDWVAVVREYDCLTREASHVR